MLVELSESECEEIVRKAAKHENVKIVNFNLESFGNYFGFLGEYFRLKIDAVVNDSACEMNFFIKSLPFKNLKQRKMLVETGIFQKEVKLYEKLLMKLSQLSDEENFWCPNAFLFRDDMLVLDDLSLKGYKMLPFQFKFSQPHVEVTLKSLASFHCRSVVYEESPANKSIDDEFGELLFETSVCDITWFHAGLRTIRDIALQKTKFGKSHREMLEKDFYEKTFEIIKIMESLPHDVLKVLAHRDVWKNNLMFKFDDRNQPTHCVLLDFQTARYLPITIDVLMAIICTSRRKHHEEFFNYYIKFYYDQFAKELEKFNIKLDQKMSFENFAKSCDYHKTFALVYNVIVLMITTIPQDYFAKTSEDEFRDFAEGNRSKFILDNMNEDAYYAECLVEAVEAAVEFIYKLP